MAGIELGTRVSLYPQELIFQCSFMIWEWKFEEYLLKFEEEGIEEQKAKKWSKGSKGNGRIKCLMPGRRVTKRRLPREMRPCKPAIPTLVSWPRPSACWLVPCLQCFPSRQSWTLQPRNCPSCVPDTNTSGWHSLWLQPFDFVYHYCCSQSLKPLA